MEIKIISTFLFALVAVCAMAAPQDDVKSLPPAEQAMANDINPYGLGFADQLRLFRENYAKASKAGPADFVIGWQHGLDKVFRTKYWFRGAFASETTLTCARGEHENVQIAVMPDVGGQLKGVTLNASEFTGAAGNLATDPRHPNVEIYRVGYVRTPAPAYPVQYVGEWPDPLLPNAPMDVNGADLGLFWIDVYAPVEAKPGVYTSTLTIATASGGKREFKLHLKVLPFELPKRTMPMVVWTDNKNPWGQMTNEEYDNLALMYIDHGIDPVRAWADLYDSAKPETADAVIKRHLDAGMPVIDIPRKFLNKQDPVLGRLAKLKVMDRAIVYGDKDEPLLDVFEKDVIPDTQRIRAMKPAPKVYLASDYLPGIDRGVDIWMTDPSTGGGLDYALANKGKADLWVYYCHLPIHVGLNAPIPDAPNMLIDNPAIEQRLAYWLAWKYGVKGMFIWAGNMGWDKANGPDWIDKGWQLTTEKAGYPYAGIHNGNGYEIYPGPTPSVRMKVIRDGVEDYGYMQLLSKNLNKLSPKDGAAAKELLKVPTSVMVNSHYFTRNPADLIAARQKIADLIVKAGVK